MSGVKPSRTVVGAVVLLASAAGAGCGNIASQSHIDRFPRGINHANLISSAIFAQPQVVPEVRTSASSLPADCVPEPSGPPNGPYQLGLVGTVTNGVLDTGTTRVANIKAKFCAVVTVVAGQPPCGATGSVNSPPDGQVFGSLSATLTLIPSMSPTVPFKATPGHITGGFACASSVNGLEVNVDATVSGTTGLFGLSCTIGPFTVPLSGVLTGPFNDASITLRGNDFVVPGVSSSARCPGNVPAGLDEVAGLPIPAGQASLILPATAALYRPPTP